MKNLLLTSLVIVLAGCCSFEKCEEMVGKCNKQKEFVQAPARTRWVIGDEIKVPNRPRLQVFDWTFDQIRLNPVGYITALYSDFAFLDDFSLKLIAYLQDLKDARTRAIEKARALGIELEIQ